MKRILYALTLLFVYSSLSAADYLITAFGAFENQLSTSAIQKAVNACYAAGGGRVIVPRGIFVSGTIELKSNVILHLENGAFLLGSKDLKDYAVSFRTHGIIFCQDAENVGITGYGTIDARGTHFYDTTQNHVYDEFNKQLTRQKEGYMPDGEFYTDGPVKRKPKPGMSISFFNCSRVILKDFILKDTPSWAIRLAYCDDVQIQGISIKNNLMVPNSDGVHCTTSRNVRMSDCDIRAGDDAFIVTGFTTDEEKPGYDYATNANFRFGNKTIYAENISVTNCQLQSRSSGIRIGYGQHPIRRCTFSNIVIYGSNRGIGVFAHDAADIEDLIFSDIVIQTRLHNGQWWGNGEPIHLSSVSRFKGEPVGVIRNVTFQNIIGTGEHGILVYGHKDAPMENIRFGNITLTIVKGKETMTYGGNFDLRPAADISKQLFEHDIPGFFARYVNGLSIDGFHLTWGNDLPEFFTHGISCEYINDLWISKFEGDANPNSKGSQRLRLFETKVPGIK